MGKLVLHERAQRFADRCAGMPACSNQEALRYGFSQGYRAHQRDVRAMRLEPPVNGAMAGEIGSELIGEPAGPLTDLALPLMPTGYDKAPLDYAGRVWLEGQIHQYQRACETRLATAASEIASLQRALARALATNQRHQEDHQHQQDQHPDQDADEPSVTSSARPRHG